jgi:hypothetical protein
LSKNRSLPLVTGTLAPVAAPARRHLPLATASRAVDRRYRPTHAIWEITLRCDLACRHCGSRAGRARPDELDIVACLDLVRQMAELGVLEVSLIGVAGPHPPRPVSPSYFAVRRALASANSR